jgi:hypothetical protein
VLLLVAAAAAVVWAVCCCADAHTGYQACLRVDHDAACAGANCQHTTNKVGNARNSNATAVVLQAVKSFVQISGASRLDSSLLQPGNHEQLQDAGRRQTSAADCASGIMHVCGLQEAAQMQQPDVSSPASASCWALRLL